LAVDRKYTNSSASVIWGTRMLSKIKYSFPCLCGLALLLLGFAAPAFAQAPYVLPYTMNTLAGPHALYTGTFPQPCTAGTTAPLAYNTYGDGCPTNLFNVGIDPHDVRVDGLGNVYWLDDTSSTNIVVHHYNPRTGLVTVYAGGSATLCSGSAKWGDNCVASDNMGNVKTDTTGTYPGYTGNFSGRGLAVAGNNDLYLAGYGSNTVQKITYSTHVMTDFAGSALGVAGYQDSVLAANGGLLSGPRGVGIDANSNVYVADTANQAIRMVSTSNDFISTIGGSGSSSGSANTSGYSGSPSPIATSLFSGPEDIKADTQGNVWVSDTGNSAIRVLCMTSGCNLPNNIGATTGNWYTVAGKGSAAYPGSPTPGTNIALAARKFSLDKYNNLYMADSSNDVVWFLDHVTGYVRIIAGTRGKTSGGAGCGNGSAVGDGCPATSATLSPLSDMGVDADQMGDIYITDQEGATSTNPTSRIREVVTGQTFGTVATGASLTNTVLVHVNPIMSNGVPTATDPLTTTTISTSDFTITGTPASTVNADDSTDYTIPVQFKPTRPGPATAALRVTTNSGLTASFSITGSGSGPSVAIDPGSITALPAASVAFVSPLGIYADTYGNTYIADRGGNRVFFLNAATNTTSVIAGTGVSGYTGDNAVATSATLNAPQAVVADAAGNVYIADTGNNVIRRVDAATGIITTFAGGTTAVCTQRTDAAGDGCPATSAYLTAPAGLAFDGLGNLYVSDQTPSGNSIRVISTRSYIFFVGGGSNPICSSATDTFGDGCTAVGGTAASPTGFTLSSPAGLMLDSNNNLFIADKGDNVVRKLNLGTLLITLVAGDGQAGDSVSSGSIATSSQLSAPQSIALDAAGNIYIADTGNSAIRLVTTGTGLISTIVGINGASGTGTVPGTATLAQLAAPAGISANGFGALIIADTGNGRLLADNRTQVAYSFGRTNVNSPSANITFTELGTGNLPTTLASPLYATPVPSTSGFPNYFTLLPSSTNGCAAGTVLTAGVTCELIAQFSPSASTYPTTVSATYTESSTTEASPSVPQISLSGLALVLTSTTPTITQLVPANNVSPQYGGTLTLAVIITPSGCNPLLTQCSPTGIPSGTVTFVVDSVSQAPQQLIASTTSLTSSASLTITGLSVGSHTIGVTYSGDLYFASSQFAPSSPNIIVTPASTTTLVSLTPASSAQFTTTIITANVLSNTSGIPTGSVNFYSNGSLIGAAPLNAAGVATFIEQLQTNLDGSVASNNTQAPGTYSITAIYPGGTDPNFSASPLSTAATLTITADAPTIALASKSCSSVAEALSSGVSTPITPILVCPSDLFGNGTSLGVVNSLYGGVATPTSGGSAAGTITGFMLCPQGKTCTSAINLNPTNFLTLVTFYESNSFTPGESVTVTGATDINPASSITPPPINGAGILDINYTVISATSSSWTGTLTSNVATATGSAIQGTIFLQPSNTLTGTISFSASGMPANSAVTFSPSFITLTPGTAPPSWLYSVATFFTDIQPGTVSALQRPAAHHSPQFTLALLLGWPITLASLFGVLRFRRDHRALKLLTLLVIAVGCSMTFTACGLGGPGAYQPVFTPTGTYPVTITASNGTVSQSIVVNFTVIGPGIVGIQ
jgi:streptogramin lyase